MSDLASLPPVGLIPAAGWGRRLGTLPCSKELLPIGWTPDADGAPRPKVVSHYLLDKMRRAGVETAYVVIRDGKWDVPAYWGDGQAAGIHLAYLMMRLPYGTPFSMDQARPFLSGRRVVMGFPDILFSPEDTYVHLLDRQAATGADVVLGLIPTDRPHKADVVEMDAAGRPCRLHIKASPDALADAGFGARPDSWVCAVWGPRFTDYLGDAVAAATPDANAAAPELYVGHVVQAALDDGLHVEAVRFPDATFTDIGTPHELARVVTDHAPFLTDVPALPS